MRNYTRDTITGIFVIIGLICVAYLTIKLGKMELTSGNDYTVYARFTSISGLRVGAGVEISGVSVGKVTAISLEQDDEGSYALVTMKVNNGIELTDSCIASVKTSGLIGDKYISLSPGGSLELLKNNSEIVDTESALDIEALIKKYVFGNIKGD